MKWGGGHKAAGTAPAPAPAPHLRPTARPCRPLRGRERAGQPHCGASLRNRESREARQKSFYLIIE